VVDLAPSPEGGEDFSFHPQPGVIDAQDESWMSPLQGVPGAAETGPVFFWSHETPHHYGSGESSSGPPPDPLSLLM